MQDPYKRQGYLQTAATKPSLLLSGENPRLIDEWQDAPVLWDAVRLSVDARNISTLAKESNILKDVVSASESISHDTLSSYIQAFEKLFIIQDIDAWCPSIRSASAIRSGKKRGFCDPSIAVAASGLNPEYYMTDLQSFGFIFESLCMRDLRAYSAKSDGKISYYHDRYNLEADCVLHLRDGKYALIEFKLGSNEIEEASSHLLEIKRLVCEYNEKGSAPLLREPDLLIIITGTEYAYRRPDGVYVIPIGCLRD